MLHTHGAQAHDKVGEDAFGVEDNFFRSLHILVEALGRPVESKSFGQHSLLGTRSPTRSGGAQSQAFAK